MLIGRAAEQAEIQRALADAAHGHGRALVVRGEAGIGKTALLEQAAETVDGFRVLRALGVESEAELAFAALDELVRPIVELIEALPPPQANALKAALALEEREAVDRFSAYAATLGLVAAAAAEQPVLCMVDDAHWLDHASAEALVFAARRIEHDPVAMLFAVRDPATASFSAPGLAEIRLSGLTLDEAKALIARQAPALSPPAVTRIAELSEGNPLALLEFAPTALESREIDEPVPISEAVERGFLERSSKLGVDAQRALLLLAAHGPSEQEALWAALEDAELTPSLDHAQRAGMIMRGRRLDFAHPLARSAIYHAAAPTERRAAHRSLAEHTTDSERRAWHLAAAATGPDEHVAAALEHAAVQARSRGGVTAEASALERAAQLTPDQEAAARRLLAAGLAAEAAGRLERAEELFALAAATTSDDECRADAVSRRSYLLFDRGDFESAADLATAEAERLPPAIAARLLTASGLIHALLHVLDVSGACRVAERARELAGDEAHGNLDLVSMLSWTRELSGRRAEALQLARDTLERTERGTILALDIASHVLFLEDYETARRLYDELVARERDVGALGNLAYAVDHLAILEARTGRLTKAYANAAEALQLTESLGNDVAIASQAARLALLEAMLGRSADAREHGELALQVSRNRGDRWNEVRARAALGAEALAQGDAEGAVRWLAPAEEMLASAQLRDPNLFRIDGDLIEAQVRLGNAEEARRLLSNLLDQAEETESPWALAVGARCRGLIAEGPDVDEAFEAALELHAHEPSDWERARTQLVYGERLRRLRQRRAAREQLQAALVTFDSLGSTPWAERARAELRASGERLRPRGPTAHEQLTPRELQVSLSAAEGLTSKEIGARLFLSPRTVDFHLGRAYRKLGVRSRAELARLFAEQGSVADQLPA